ncbi:gamma-aminobutyric acid type B receptor subunit 1 isoform X1 [Cimex lectularius]|uniref:Gamma-aminobutyric acid type B receptor subunit 2 n=1 Tax=Cimex lectularius TaxID=79782 RepID=A0A8I6SQK9_CIMLE|nr:gamma-aminobutyric acid type B receptor subunit 1 isoform X1 [Cimex lectularius]
MTSLVIHQSPILLLLFVLVLLPSPSLCRAPRPPSRSTTCGDKLCEIDIKNKLNARQNPLDFLYLQEWDFNLRDRCEFCPQGDESGIVVTILGLFELTVDNEERKEGKWELEAANLAVRHINEQNILGPKYKLALIVNDTKCDPGVGLDAFFHALYTRKEKMAFLLGTSNSEVTESLSKVIPYWNMLQVSFGSTSPALSIKKEFPHFYRTVAPDSSHNLARIEFLRRFSWETVTIFSQNEDVYSLAVNDLVTELEQSNISCGATITFAEADINDQLKILRELDTRIIIGSFSHSVAPKVFCEAYSLGMYGEDYAWLIQGRPKDRWWMKTDVCGDNLSKATNGIIFIASFDSLIGNLTASSGLLESDIEEMLEGKSGDYIRQTYDAVWAIALTLRSFMLYMSIEDFDYNRRDMSRQLSKEMSKTTFNGISGPVRFNGPDRIGFTALYQIQGGDSVMVGLFDGFEKELTMPCSGCKPVVWPGDQVPISKRVFKLRTVTVQPVAFFSIATFSMIGIGVAMIFLIANLHFRKHK